MIVRVRLFARARDLAGADAVRVELPDGATVAELRRRLADDHARLAPLLERSALAVDDEFAAEDQVLTTGSEIALLPPVSGGARKAKKMHDGKDRIAGDTNLPAM